MNSITVLVRCRLFTNCRMVNSALFYVRRAGAVGSERLVLPGGVGFEIDSGNNFFIMDSHYDNPDLAKNVVDISGAKLYFADDRPIQAGVLVLGDARQSLSLTGQTIKNQFEYTSSCPSKCTATWKDDINVFLSHLHMHTTGRKIATQHYSKNGTLIQNINSVSVSFIFCFQVLFQFPI